MNDRIIEAGTDWGDWLASPPGRYLIGWEQKEFDTFVADVFGYFALHCGTPWIDCLRGNRMPCRIRAILPGECEGDVRAMAPGCTTIRLAHFEELPFASQSLDLVVLAHVLERSGDPYQVLREVDRVLRPEGRVMVSGLNPLSMWAVRRAIPHGLLPPFVPGVVSLLAAPRLRDWLRLLGFDLDRTRFGCFRPPCRTQRWLDRTSFLESAGDRWWPILGAVYMVSGIKRVHGMRLVGPAWKKPVASRVGGAVAANRQGTQRGPVSDTCTRATSEAD